MKKVIKLTEQDLEKIISKVIKEQQSPKSDINPKKLKLGDGGEQSPEKVNDVRELQQKLTNLGLLKLKSNETTGYFGNKTLQALDTYNGGGLSKTFNLINKNASNKSVNQNKPTQNKVDNKTSSEGIFQKIKSKLTSSIQPGVSSFLRKRFPNIAQVLSGRVLTSNDFTSNQKKTLVSAIKNSEKRPNQQKSGSVDYIDYGQDVSKTFENEKGSPSNWDVAWNSVTNNDRFAMATLFGKFSWVKNSDGSYSIDDKYDFKNPRYEQISGVNRKSLEGKSISQLKKEYDLGTYEAVRVKAWVDYPEEIPGRAIPLKLTLNPSEFA